MLPEAVGLGQHFQDLSQTSQPANNIYVQKLLNFSRAQGSRAIFISAIQGYTELYRAIQSYTELYRAIQSYTGLYTAIHSYTQLYRAIQS